VNTSNLIDTVATQTGSSKADAKKTVDAVLSSIADTLASGEEVNLNGFGKFTIKERSAREGRNPKTGEALTIAASKSVGFKVSSTLKNRLG